MPPERAPRRFAVTVVYALPDAVIAIELRVSRGATVAAAIERSGIAARLPPGALGGAAVGIFGRRVPRDTRLQAGDRIEIYRPLRADPGVARQKRARERLQD